MTYDPNEWHRDYERRQGVIRGPNPPAPSIPQPSPIPEPAIPPGTWEKLEEVDPGNPRPAQPNPYHQTTGDGSE
jgi:hypothetical protein